MTELLGVDFHTHILPETDDGSRSVEESIRMLRAEAAASVHTVLATPHFYADREAPQAFGQRRDRAQAKLRRAMHIAEDGGIRLPKLKIGAEVLYYPGISRIREDSLRILQIEGSELLLVEMPFADWSTAMVGELAALNRREGVQVVLAHIDRYFGRHNLPLLEELNGQGILLQVNADSTAHFLSARLVRRFLRDGQLAFFGSDCHNMTDRPPNLNEARQWLMKKCGADSDACEALRENARRYFG